MRGFDGKWIRIFCNQCVCAEDKNHRNYNKLYQCSLCHHYENKHHFGYVQCLNHASCDYCGMNKNDRFTDLKCEYCDLILYKTCGMTDYYLEKAVNVGVTIKNKKRYYIIY